MKKNIKNYDYLLGKSLEEIADEFKGRLTPYMYKVWSCRLDDTFHGKKMFLLLRFEKDIVVMADVVYSFSE